MSRKPVAASVRAKGIRSVVSIAIILAAAAYFSWAVPFYSPNLKGRCYI